MQANPDGTRTVAVELATDQEGQLNSESGWYLSYQRCIPVDLPQNFHLGTISNPQDGSAPQRDVPSPEFSSEQWATLSQEQRVAVTAKNNNGVPVSVTEFYTTSSPYAESDYTIETGIGTINDNTSTPLLSAKMMLLLLFEWSDAGRLRHGFTELVGVPKLVLMPIKLRRFLYATCGLKH